MTGYWNPVVRSADETLREGRMAADLEWSLQLATLRYQNNPISAGS